MRARTIKKLVLERLVVSTSLALGAGCGGGKGAAPGAPGEIPIVAAAGADVPYRLGKICLSGTVEMVPVPTDGSHPPYSDYWGIELGFNLNQGADAAKNPWPVPAGVTGFWFTVEGQMIPPIRFKTTPTGKDPALEQDSCAAVYANSGEANDVPFAEMYVQCWDGPQGTGTTDVSNGLVDMGLQVAAVTGEAYPLDFCLTHVGVMTGP